MRLRLVSAQAVLRSYAHALLATLVVGTTAHCGGGGERPPPEQDPAPPIQTEPEGDTITISPPLSAEGLLFGDNSFVDCGKQAGAKEITLYNPTNDVVSFTAKLTSGQAHYKLNPEQGAGIPVRGRTTLQIIPNPIPQESSVATDLYAGTLEITTNVRKEVEDPPTVIRLHQTARGAVITSTIVGDVDFGDIKVGTAGISRFSFTNLGNVSAGASFSLGSQVFRIDDGQTAVAVLEPGTVANKTLSATPSTTGEYNDSLAVSYDTTTVHCKNPPTAVKLKSRGTTSVGVAPGALSFGNVNCGSAAAAKTIEISTTVAMKFRAGLGKGNAFYTVENDATGEEVELGTDVSMAAGATFVMKVKPKIIARPATMTANFYNDTLAITTNVAGDVVHDVTLTESPQGAVFTFDKAEIKQEGQEINNATNNAFTVKNTGNASAPFTLSIVAQPPFPAPPEAAFNLINSSQQDGAVGDSAQSLTIVAPGAYSQSQAGAIRLTPAAGAILCASPPSDLPVSVKTKAPPN